MHKTSSGDPLAGFAGTTGAGKGSGPHRPCFAEGSPSQTRWIAFGVPTPRREAVSLVIILYDTT
jgi:hypothetical protein